MLFYFHWSQRQGPMNAFEDPRMTCGFQSSYHQQRPLYLLWDEAATQEVPTGLEHCGSGRNINKGWECGGSWRAGKSAEGYFSGLMPPWPARAQMLLFSRGKPRVFSLTLHYFTAQQEGETTKRGGFWSVLSTVLCLLDTFLLLLPVGWLRTSTFCHHKGRVAFFQAELSFVHHRSLILHWRLHSLPSPLFLLANHLCGQLPRSSFLTCCLQDQPKQPQVVTCALFCFQGSLLFIFNSIGLCLLIGIWRKY